jgi:hypothetical protein
MEQLPDPNTSIAMVNGANGTAGVNETAKVDVNGVAVPVEVGIAQAVERVEMKENGNGTGECVR